MESQTDADIISIKEKVRERDGHACTACGMSHAEHVEKYGATLDVHRDTPGSRYSLDGCRTLCRGCHWRMPRQVSGSGTLPPGVAFADVCSVAEAAVILGVSKSRVEQFIRRGLLNVVSTVGVRGLLRSDVASLKSGVRGKAGRPPKSPPPAPPKPRKGKKPAP